MTEFRNKHTSKLCVCVCVRVSAHVCAAICCVCTCARGRGEGDEPDSVYVAIFYEQTLQFPAPTLLSKTSMVRMPVSEGDVNLNKQVWRNRSMRQ